MKKWVQERWIYWDEDKPEWFTGRVRKSIPVDMIPEVKEEEEKGAAAGQAKGDKKGERIEKIGTSGRRRSSVEIVIAAIQGRIDEDEDENEAGE